MELSEKCVGASVSKGKSNNQVFFYLIGRHIGQFYEK